METQSSSATTDAMRFLVDFQIDGIWTRFMDLTCRRTVAWQHRWQPGFLQIVASQSPRWIGTSW
jgi:hypothetical protein